MVANDNSTAPIHRVTDHRRGPVCGAPRRGAVTTKVSSAVTCPDCLNIASREE